MTAERQEGQVPDHGEHTELDPEHPDVIVRYSNRIVRFGVRLLSIIMVIVIVCAIVESGFLIVIRLLRPPVLILDVADILAVFNAALMVLIAIEIYTNVTLYLTKDVIHVKLVVATALMAVSRKVITLDSKDLAPEYFMAYGLLALAFGVTYWLLSRKE